MEDDSIRIPHPHQSQSRRRPTKIDRLQSKAFVGQGLLLCAIRELGLNLQEITFALSDFHFLVLTSHTVFIRRKDQGQHHLATTGSCCCCHLHEATSFAGWVRGTLFPEDHQARSQQESILLCTHRNGASSSASIRIFWVERDDFCSLSDGSCLHLAGRRTVFCWLSFL